MALLGLPQRQTERQAPAGQPCIAPLLWHQIIGQQTYFFSTLMLCPERSTVSYKCTNAWVIVSCAAHLGQTASHSLGDLVAAVVSSGPDPVWKHRSYRQ